MKSSTRFGDMARDLSSVGFPSRDLLPLIPPGAKLSANSVVKPFQIGKIPGRYHGGVWSGLSGAWPTFGLAERDQEAAANWPTQNVGLRAADFPGIDCDTSSKEALAMVERLVTSMFGTAIPVRERGNAPRALFVFRRDGEVAIRKTRLEFTDTSDAKHAVEVLGLGQQYVISGIHPSGAAYEWRERATGTKGKSVPGDLVAYRASGLTPLTADDVNRFMATLRDEIISRGWTVTSTVAAKYGAEGRSAGVLVSKAEPLFDKEFADLPLQALCAIPNTVETLPQREDLISLLSSFKHAVGRTADTYYDRVLEWATTDPEWCDKEYFDKIWDSLTTARVSPDHLLFTARKYGWRGDALLDFKDFGEEETSEAGEMTTDEKIRHAQENNDDEQSRLERLSKKLVYSPAEQIFINVENGDVLTAEALNNSSLGTSVASAGLSGIKTTANRLRNTPGLLREVKGIVYLPGQSHLANWEREGRAGVFYNRWHAHAIVLPESVTDDDVRPWLDHAAYLVPDAEDRSLLFDFFAHCIQNRGVKVRWAPLMIGKQGTGKDLLIKPLMMFFGHNARDVRPEQLSAKFNSFLENELLVVQEMKKTNKTSSLYNQIKTLLAGTATDVNFIEKKFRDAYAVPNTVNSVFFSNHLDAMEIDDDDRRFFVLLSDVEKREFEYYRSLAEDFYRAKSGWRAVIRWLMQRDISHFDANNPPKRTLGKDAIIDAQRTALYRALKEMLTFGDYKDRKAVTANEIFDRIKNDYNLPVDNGTRQKVEHATAVTNELGHLGWSSVGYPLRVKVGGKMDQIRLWHRPGVTFTNAELRQEYEAAHQRVSAETPEWADN